MKINKKNNIIFFKMKSYNFLYYHWCFFFHFEYLNNFINCFKYCFIQCIKVFSVPKECTSRIKVFQGMFWKSAAFSTYDFRHWIFFKFSLHFLFFCRNRKSIFCLYNGIKTVTHLRGKFARYLISTFPRAN